MKIEISEIRQICKTVLISHGVQETDADTIVSEYLYGELCGKKSHGLVSFLNIVDKLKIPKGKWKVVREDDSYALVDANGNLGQLAGKFAMELAINKAKSKGIAMVGIYNMQTYLMPGYMAKIACDNGMVGIVINNSKPAVAPYGGIDPKYGPNPIGIAIPSDPPFVLDMATSTRAKGEVREAKRLGEKLHEGVAIDEIGEPTTDPDLVHALTPLGGHKGYGLGIAIEMLVGSLVRAKMGEMVESGLDRGYLFIVINPDVFVDAYTFKKETAEFVKSVKSSKKSEGVEEILIPGERSGRIMHENMRNGTIDVNDMIIEKIRLLK